MGTASWNPMPALTEDEAAAGEERAAEDRRHLYQFEKLRELLEQEPFRVEFFQAVRLLQRMEKGTNPVGYFVPPGSEAVRFAAHTTLSFPPSQIYDVKRGQNGQLKMEIQFMGLCASVTIMPSAYKEYLLTRLKNKDTAMQNFFDLFDHRMISLFYRGWEKYRFFIGYEAGQREHLTPRMMDLLGLGTEGLAQRTALPDAALLAYAGLLGRHTRSAAGLKQILEDYFNVPVTIVQFAGTWRSLPPDHRTAFAGSNRASERLGVGTVVGNEVWDHHGRIRICIGPVGYREYLSFLPGPGAYRDLEAWVRFYSSGQYEAEVQLLLKREDVPGCQLGAQGAEAPLLGLVSWLKTRPVATDPGDAIFLLN
jgi:type VI secretion system protein ImpH